MAKALRAGAGLYTQAARILEGKYGSCAPNTVRNYVMRHAKLQQVMSEVTDMQLDLAEGQLLKAIGDGNLTAIIFYLKCKGRDRGYIERRQIEGPDGGPISIKPDLSALTNDELHSLREVARSNTTDPPES